MNSMTRVIGIVFALVLFVHPGKANAQSLDIDSLVLKTIGDIASELPSFTDAQTSLQSALAGTKPSHPVNFAQLATEARAMADDLKTPPASPWSNWNTYTVNINDLRGCQTHATAMAQLKLNAANLDAAIQAGQAKLDKINVAIQQVQASQAAAQFLDKNLQYVINAPWYGSVFVGNMMDVHNDVVPAFGTLLFSLTKYRDQFASSLSQASTESENLKANIVQLQTWNPDSGLWRGFSSGAGTNFGGGQYILYHVDLNNVYMQVSISNSGALTGADAQGFMTEHPLNAHVGVIPSNTHHFQFAGGYLSGMKLFLNLPGTPQNAPRSSASFIGNFVNNCSSIQGVLDVGRSDGMPAPLLWHLAISLNLTRP